MLTQTQMRLNEKIIIFGVVGLIFISVAVLFYATWLAKKAEVSLVVDKIEDVKGLGYSGQRKVAMSEDGTIFLAYRKKYQNKYEIFVARAVLEKSGWKISGTDNPISAVGKGVDQRVPSIAIDTRGNIHAVWYGADSSKKINNRQIKYSRSEDGGATWSAWANIALVDGYDGEDYWQEHPNILAGVNGELFVVWEGKDKDNGDQQIKFSKSYDGGKTWVAWKNIQLTAKKTQSRPTLVQDKNGRLYLFMYSSFGNNNDRQQIQYIWSDSQGESWSPWQSISDPDYDSRHATAAVDSGGAVHVAWRAQKADVPSQIMYRSLKNGSWSAITPVAVSERFQFFPSIGIGASGKIRVSWMESEKVSSLPNEDPSDGWVFMADLKSGLFSAPEEISTGSINLYPQLPEKFDAAVAPVFFESGSDLKKYELFLKVVN